MKSVKVCLFAIIIFLAIGVVFYYPPLVSEVRAEMVSTSVTVTAPRVDVSAEVSTDDFYDSSSLFDKVKNFFTNKLSLKSLKNIFVS